MIQLKSLFKLAPAMAIKYFRKKNNKFSWDWYELWQDAHKKSFTVAKAMREDILKDIRSALEKALTEGKTFREFSKELKPTLQKKGWWGEQIVVDSQGVAEKVQLGSMYRLKTIYSVNAIHERLDKVMIENRDFETLIKQYDFEDAFFYCDPPYSQGCGYDVTSTKDFDHERLREVLGNIKGRFLLSYDDSPKIRELYKGFEMIEVERLNGINNRSDVENRKKIFRELLIANYPIKEVHERQADRD